MPTFTPNFWPRPALLAGAGACIPIATFLALGAAVTVFPDIASDVQLSAIILAGAVVGLGFATTGTLRIGRTGRSASLPAVVSALLINGYVATGTIIALLDLLKRH